MATERIPLPEVFDSRDGTLNKDSKVQNGLLETNGHNKDLVKRPGMRLIATIPNYYGTGANTYSQALGIAFGGMNSSIYVFCQRQLYAIVNANTLSPTVTSITTPLFDGYSGVSSIMQPDSTKLYFSGFSTGSGNLLGVVDTLSQTFSTIVAGPSSSLYVKGLVDIDGYLFGCFTIGNGSYIYNSKNLDYSTWYTGYVLVPNYCVCITKHLNYLVAFSGFATHFYYNAGTGTSTVSPLQEAQSYSFEIGCAHADSVAACDNTVVFIGQSTIGGYSVYMLDGVSPIKISTTAIDKVLAKGLASNTNFLFGITVPIVSAYAVKIAGHTLYVLNFYCSGVTIVYDLLEKTWVQWSSYGKYLQTDGSVTNTTGEWCYNGAYAVNSTFYFRDNSSVPVIKSGTENILLHKTTGSVYQVSENLYQDDNNTITLLARTDQIDNGSTKRKFYDRLEIVGDKQPGSTMQIRHSGDDYNTFSSYRTVDLNASRPQLWVGGADRRRSWDFLHTSNTPLRLESAEINFRMGELDEDQGQGASSVRR